MAMRMVEASRDRVSIDATVLDSQELHRSLQKIQDHLAASRVTLDTETAAWGRGPFRLRVSFKIAFGQLIDMVNDLRLLSVVINREPNITGIYRGTVARRFIQPLQEEFSTVNRDVLNLSISMALRLRYTRRGAKLLWGCFACGPLTYYSDAILANLRTVQESRQRFKERYAVLRSQMYEEWIQLRNTHETAELPVHADDILRLYAYMHVAEQVLTALCSLARTLAHDPSENAAQSISVGI